jgi:hypothetical protein
MSTFRAKKPPNPNRAEIKPQVDHVLNSARAHAGNSAVPEPIDDDKDLTNDLLLGPQTKEALAISYTSLALQYQGGRPVSLADAGGCHTVGDAVDLVRKRACGKS